MQATVTTYITILQKKKRKLQKHLNLPCNNSQQKDLIIKNIAEAIHLNRQAIFPTTGTMIVFKNITVETTQKNLY